jgi:hypothetical protein
VIYVLMFVAGVLLRPALRLCAVLLQRRGEGMDLTTRERRQMMIRERW